MDGLPSDVVYHYICPYLIVPDIIASRLVNMYWNRLFADDRAIKHITDRVTAKSTIPIKDGCSGWDYLAMFWTNIWIDSLNTSSASLEDVCREKCETRESDCLKAVFHDVSGLLKMSWPCVYGMHHSNDNTKRKITVYGYSSFENSGRITTIMLYDGWLIESPFAVFMGMK